MVLAPARVLTLWTIANFPGDVSPATVSVPSRQLANAWPLWNFVASTLSPIGRASRTLPSGGLQAVTFLGLWAAEEEPPLFRVYRHPNRRTTGSHGPARHHPPGLNVDHGYFVFVHQIDVDLAGPIGREEFGRAAQNDRRIDFSTLRIDIRLER